MTVPELRRLLHALLWLVQPAVHHVLAWSRWRRQCQFRAQRAHRRRQQRFLAHMAQLPCPLCAAVGPEVLVHAGKIRCFGWSTDEAERMRFLPRVNMPLLFSMRFSSDHSAMLYLCDEHDLASINCGPLAQGILTGKFTAQTEFAEKDMRRRWGWQFHAADLAELNRKISHLRDVLTSDGRSMTQAALSWILTRSSRTLPIPSFNTVARVEEDVGAVGDRC